MLGALNLSGLQLGIMIAGVVVAVISGTWAGAVASGKERSMQGWFLVGFFLPIIGVIVIYLLPKSKGGRGEKQ